MTDSTSFPDQARSHPGDAEFGDYLALLKPRVMSLVVFTALVGLLVAPVPVHPFVAFASILFVALGGRASGALNMWWDADIDAVMKRTAKRPVPSGRVAPGEALGLGLALSGLSVMMLGLAANWLAAGILAFTIFFYVVVYTMWLKRWTPQNIVIGGLAGAIPPMIGWVVATGSISLEAVLMVALIFMWTPPHFWALALFMNDDYTRAGVPMLTVTHGRRATRAHILAYTLALAPVAIGVGVTSIGGPVYLATALVLNALFIAGGVMIWRRDEAAAAADRYRLEKRVFSFSLLYLFLHFTALLADAALRPFQIGGLVMAFTRLHEIHTRRRGRNIGLGLVLAAFVALVFGLTIVKVESGHGAALKGYDHECDVALLPATEGLQVTNERRTALALTGIVVVIAALSFAAVPFYSWFCRVTGFAGTPAIAAEAPGKVLDQTVRIRFDASIERGMPWRFRPVEREMTVRLGETALAFYEATNPTDEVTAGRASYNVTPDAAGGYFSKIHCFCFEMQVLQPGETVQMPVTFFVDPEILKDPDGRGVHEITLSYTFHSAPLPEARGCDV